MEELQRLLASLDWDRPVEEQKAAIQKLHRYKEELIHSIITATEKSQWENAVEYISRLNLEDQIKYVPQLFVLLQDKNWPGALHAVELMKQMSVHDLEQPIAAALRQADEENDTIWIAWIKRFIEDLNSNDLLSKHRSILKKAEW